MMIQDSYVGAEQQAASPTSSSAPSPGRGQRRRRSRSSRGGRLSPTGSYHRIQSSLESIPEDLCKDSFAAPEDSAEPATTATPLQWVNRERARRHLPAFRPSPQLERLAARHCRRMAEQQTVFHSVRTIDELVEQLQAPHAAESIQRGDSLPDMHLETVRHKRSVNYCNLVSTVFTEFGAAACRGPDGRLYQCQLFRN